MGRKRIYRNDQKFDLKQIFDMATQLETTIINHLNGDHTDEEKKEHLEKLGNEFVIVGESLIAASEEM